MDIEPLSLLVFGLSLILVLFTAAAEYALTTVSRSEVRKKGETGDGRAVVAENLLREPAQFLVTSLLLRTAGLVFAGAAIARFMPGAISWGQLTLAVALTWLLLSAAQVFARVLVVPRGLTTALRVAPILQVAARLLWPASILLRLLGARLPGEEQEDTTESVFLSEQGLRLLLDVGEEEESILESEKQMIESILGMDETAAREVMVPRIDIVAIDVQTSLRDALDIIIEAGHSRIPVFEGNIDAVVGFLYAKDLLQCFRENRDDRLIRDLLRPAYYVPVSKKLNTLLRELQRDRVHIAMVVDEYGGTAGLVTIEDILEEIVGDIQDEYDPEEDVYVQPIGTDVYLLNARCDVYSLSKLLNVGLPDEDADTLGGLIYSLLGHVPEQGEAVRVGDWQFTVLSLDGRRIDQVRAELMTEPDDAHDDPAAEQQPQEDNARSVLKYSVSD